MKIYNKAILPIGFKANGVASGIKKSKKLDLALFYSAKPAKTACKFTSNKIQAAPILVCKKYLKSNKIFNAIIVNSGNANCFTGEAGVKDAESSVKAVAKALGTKIENILVASTGIIGKRLPVWLIKKSISHLVAGLTHSGIDKARLAIMTTDTFAKEVSVRFNIGNSPITICGVAKGAGMISPNMATMLSFILTDANITNRALNKALAEAVNNSFNCITVDGCMSTNDSLIMLANGASNNVLIEKGKNFDLFVKTLGIVCLRLAKMIIKDAEGASKFIQITVKGTRSFKEAKVIALNIANSNLFKTAMYGQNPNFGRIVAAAGASGIDIKEKDIKIKVSPLTKQDIYVDLSVGKGSSFCTVYTSDLTPEYIKINAEYN